METLIKRAGAYWTSSKGELFAWDEENEVFLSVRSARPFSILQRIDEDTAVIAPYFVRLHA